ncbi:hypothetical protein GXW79_14980 [Roseomonas arctica]|uniref:Uncharacterized protein n=1 Tax=Plastoroseomonas arctica TaxID=1509237 RepID=A0AAF1KKD6_9PROT|nr:hypothetical protein [Plastoroseomonas arctica]
MTPAPVPAVVAAPLQPEVAPPPVAPTGRGIRILVAGRSIALPSPSGTGIAVFRRGGAVLAVFDVPGALDLAGLRDDPTFGEARSWMLPDGAVLLLPLPVGMTVEPRREGETWVLEVEAVDATRRSGQRRRPIMAEAEPGPPARLVIGIEGGSRVLAMEDPETGSPLLIGTLIVPGQAHGSAWRLPEFEVLSTRQGAAILARSDRVALRSLPGRFTLSVPGGSMRIAMPGGLDLSAEAVRLTRLLDLPALSVSGLLDRLRSQQSSIATSLPLARGGTRRDTAETLLAMGMPHEAQAMAALALQEDPRMRGDARLLLAYGASALLAGRIGDAAAIEDARIPASDEVLVWRGLLAAARGDAGLAASGITPGMALLFTYPEALRQRLLPMAALALAESDAVPATRRLLAALPETPAYAYARARLSETEGEAAEAARQYAALTESADRPARARAMRRLAELRLVAGEIDARSAAEALDRAIFSWRGDADELALRLRVATLRRAAGEPRIAFDLLRETASLFPEHAPRLRPDIAASLAEAILREPPVAAVALFELHRDLLPTGAEGAETLALLAERLVAMELPQRAIALLQEAAERASTREGRARHGTRMAVLRLAERDAAGALAALDATSLPELPPPLMTARALLRARALAASGERGAAATLLATVGAEGRTTLAAILAEAQDWTGAAAALGEHLAEVLPPGDAAFDPSLRREVARLAAFHALASETVALAGLAARVAGRMGEGPVAELFALLVADPMRGIADARRLGRELDLFRALPGRLSAQGLF